MNCKTAGQLKRARSTPAPRWLLWLRHRWMRLRPPLVGQQEQSDCGPAALLSVLRFWGGDESLAVVRDLSYTDARGSTILGLRDAAEALGLAARGALGEFDELKKESMPCIAHLVMEDGRTHFVVVNRVTEDKVYLGDPRRGRRSCSRIEFERLWKTRSVLLVSPTERVRRCPPVKWFAWLMGYVKREPAWLVQSLFLGVVTTGLGLLTAVFIQWLIDRFIPDRNIPMILGTGTALLVVLFTRGVSRYLRQSFLIRLNRIVGSDVNEEFLSHLYRLPLRFFESRTTGDITTRIADGVRIQQGMLQISGAAVIDGLLVLGSLLCLVLIAPPLGSIALVSIPLYLVILMRVAASLRVEQKEALSAYGRVEAGYIDSMKGISDVLAFGAGSFFARTNAGLYRLFNERVERLGRIHAGLSLFSELAGGCLIIVALTWGALLVVAQDLLLRQFIAGYSLLAGVIPSTERLVQAWAGYHETAVSAARFRDLVLAPAQATGGLGSPEITIRRGLSLESLSLSWPGGERQFSDLNFSFPIGRVTGLRGVNGAGKTTLVRLLNRTYLPTFGRILADDTPVETLGLEAYRKSIAVFPADVHLFSGSIAHNVLLGRFADSHSSALSTLEDLGFASFLDRFAARWLETIGEGARRLSSGERQVVGLIRALADSPQVLLVDEGLAGTDRDLRNLMVETLLRYGQEHAVLLVSHDAEVLRRTEHLVILAKGGIQAEGPPGPLLHAETDSMPLRVSASQCAPALS